MDVWQYLEIAGVAVGLLYLYFEYKASVWLWLTGIIMPALYIFVYYQSGFYADMGINVYYLFAGFYGWAAWLGYSRRKSAGRVSGAPKAGEGAQAFAFGTTSEITPEAAYSLSVSDLDAGAAPETVALVAPIGDASFADAREAVIAVPAEDVMPITRTPARFWLPLALVVVAFFAGISYLLINFTDSTVPLGDSFTTALSVVGLWMLARKYVEQWLVWIVVDVICSGLYFYKGLYPTGALFALYSVIAVFGYLKWLKMMKNG